jgi:hypothetical protein
MLAFGVVLGREAVEPIAAIAPFVFPLFFRAGGNRKGSGTPDQVRGDG